MKRIFKRKRVVFLAVLAVAAVTAVAAFAYFTTTGSGTGTATVGSDTALTIVQTGSTTGLTPAGGAKTVAYTITNATGNGAQNLGVVSISNISVDATHATAGCQASWFIPTAAADPVGTILDGATYTSTASTQPTVFMVNSGTNQDSCKGATLSFDLSAAAGS